ncbi:MAG: metal-dependent transcriptional regulator [Clostridiales bacterium]|nr:metal-dependent transcriptional regulator [Clostridiales bacterium]
MLQKGADFIFKTQKAYDLERTNTITFAMEDYIEMIYRTNKENIKITELAKLLNIKSSSVSKMIEKLKDLNLVEKEKYGEINLTYDGKNLGNYLLKRHNILCKFFNKINNKNNLYLVEQIEHFFDKETIESIEKFLKRMEEKND